MYVDELCVKGSRRVLVAESDCLSHPAAVQLAGLSSDVLPHELRVAAHPHIRPLHLHADKAVARCTRQRRQPTRQAESHQVNSRGGWCFRHQLVSNTSECVYNV